ncbi:uncharacterized protein TRIREDRAFT_103813 [Trichoderma reesei QM6a]|uniref:Predicted protein n=1 Tax=Hypocrea jecorina (strain QM6a) TaxID=431241 RepID=G0R9W2_HYPJQ|nr:uncharacterized protein TRIREDRAFT_103813 [Trichoderma reesei QM6a]EGR51751.1 predicted protein [Trichoderma reesei QM6a]
MSTTYSEEFQTASEGLDQVTPSQWKAILRRNGLQTAASTEITDPFTASQLRANLEHHKQTYPQPDEDAWPSCSGSTNPFTSIQLQIIHGSHVYTARSMKKKKKKKLGTKHPALQGPVLEPGRPSNRDRSVHRGDPRKRRGAVNVKPIGLRRAASSDKPTQLANHTDYHKTKKQVHIAAQSKPKKGIRIHTPERGESSKQGSRAGARLRQSQQGRKDSPTANLPAVICRQSITRATLKLGSELLNISTQKIGLSEEHVLHTTKEVALTQSQHDFGIRLCIARLPSEDTSWKALTWPLELDLFFDPNSDAVLLVNNTILDTRELLVIMPMAPGEKPTRIGALEKAALESSSSYAFFVSNRHMFDISVLPRRYVASTSAPLRLLTQGGKRTVDVLSQQAMPSAAKRTKTEATHGQSKPYWDGEMKQTKNFAKDKGKEVIDLVRDKSKGKGKATNDTPDTSEATDVLEATNGHGSPDGEEKADSQEATDPSNASTAVQTQSSNELVLASASPFPSGSDIRAGYISAASHPLNDLPVNSSIKIANATRESDYTLVRRDNIARQASTLVFKAHHSKIPGKLVAVKIWHSVFDLDFIPDAGVKVISQVSEYFLREVKNHMKVSNHSTSMRVTWPIVANPEEIPTPSNILYSKERGPVLIDFGWSTDSETVHVAGSPWYVPPEYPKEGTRGPAGDIFAFGVVMLFLMRKIPLPELLSPPLRWRIGNLRSKGPEALEALETMTKWSRCEEIARLEACGY